MKITTLGTGDAFSRESPNSAFHIAIQNKYWLFDCGPSIPKQLWRLGLADDIDVVFISHTHTDHCLGLATLINYWCSIQRTKPLHIICQKQQADTLEMLIRLGALHEPNIPYDIIWQTTRQGSLLGCEFQTAYTKHSVKNACLLLNSKLFISGDGKASIESLELMSQAQTIFHECETNSNAGGGHSSVSELLSLLPHQKNIFLYHFDERNRQALQAEIRHTNWNLLETGQEFEVTK